MKIIVTGATGFVGKNLTAYLNKQHVEVQDLSLRKIDWKDHIDKNATAIIHLAGKAHDTANTSLAEEYFIINRDLTIALFNEFLKSDIKDFFFFSSVKAVADTVDGVLYEDVMPKVVTPYGQSKLEAETYLLNQHLPDGKRLFIIRPCMINGPGNKGNLNLLYKVVEKGIPWPLAAFHNKRSFLSIDNLNYLIHQMLVETKVSSGIYNFADDNAISTNQLIGIISDTLGKKNKLLYINTNFIRNIIKFGDLLSLPLNSEQLKKLTGSYVVSNKKIKVTLGINKLPLSTVDGLRKTFKNFKFKDDLM